jgi:hypothetical protein
MGFSSGRMGLVFRRESAPLLIPDTQHGAFEVPAVNGLIFIFVPISLQKRIPNCHLKTTFKAELLCQAQIVLPHHQKNTASALFHTATNRTGKRKGIEG